MKKLIKGMYRYINFLLLIPISCLIMVLFITGPSVPGCQVYSTGTTVTYTGASNITVSDKLFNAAGGLYCIKLINCDHVHITRCKFINQKSDGSNYSGAIDITNSTNVSIDTCYFYNCGYGILGHPVSPSVKSDGTNFRCVYNQFLDIHQDSTVNGNGSAVQLNNWSGPGMRIDSNFCSSPNPNLGIGDQISIFQCDGTSGSPIRVMYNSFRGGSTNTTGKVGYVLGDVGGSWQYGRQNICVNCGAGAALVQGGTNIQITGDSYFSDGTNTAGTVGLAYGNFSGVASNNITIDSCIINWKKPDATISNKFFFTSHGEVQPTGWLTNSADHVGDPAANAGMLPNPLWPACIAIPNITYTSPRTFTVGQTVTLNPTNTGGTATMWTCSPTLPVSLSINSGTGVITGTLTATHSVATYTITASNTSGSGTFPLVITVNGTGGGKLYFSSTHKLVKGY